MEQQYLIRKATTPFILNGVTYPAGVVLVFTKYLVRSGIKFGGVQVLIEGSVYSNLTTATTDPEDFLRRYEYLFTIDGVELREYKSNGKLATQPAILTGMNVESLNIEVNGNYLSLEIFDAQQQTGVKLSNPALQMFMQVPVGFEENGTPITMSNQWDLVT